MLHCPFLLDAVGRGPLVLEGDVVRLTKDASGLSRMETLEQAISPMSKLTGPRSVGPTFPTRLPVTISRSEFKGLSRRRGSQGRVFATGNTGLIRATALSEGPHSIAAVLALRLIGRPQLYTKRLQRWERLLPAS